jgi:aminoglycoside phosphotransferase (APT) family kinase protein
MEIGDPACDLVIAYTFLHGNSKKIFKEHVDLDSNTWTRAKGWTLWKETFELCNLTDKASTTANKQRCVIEEVLNE